MRWLKRNRRKVALALAGMPLLLVLVVWLPVSAAGAYQEALESATPGAIVVQATPTEDATVTALNKVKLEQEVQQLKEQNEPDLFAWLRSNASILISTLVVVIGGLIGLFRWLADRRGAQEKELKDRENEREKRAEERFQSAVTGLGDDKEGARIGAAILLRTFLRLGYEQFYTQTFDLAVANLRHPRTSQPPADPDTLLSLTTLSQALIVVFKEAFPLARTQNEGSPQFLDAAGIQLNNAYLVEADLKRAWMPAASMRKADLTRTDLSRANLRGADLSGAKLRGVDLSRANLRGADLSGAKLLEAILIGTKFLEATLTEAILTEANLIRSDLVRADLTQAALGRANLRGANLRGANLGEAKLIETNLSGAVLTQADLSKADLSKAKLSGSKLREAILIEADLSGADLSGADLNGAKLNGAKLNGAKLNGAKLRVVEIGEADLSGADLSGADLSRTHLETTSSLDDTDLRRVKGLMKEQLEACKAKGAIIDEDPTTSSSQPTVVPLLSSRNNDTQAPSDLSAQVSTPPPDTDGSSVASSKLSSES